MPFFVSAPDEWHHVGSMVDATGLEPVSRLLQACVAVAASVSAQTAETQLRTQKLAESSRATMSSVEGLREVIEACPKPTRVPACFVGFEDR